MSIWRPDIVRLRRRERHRAEHALDARVRACTVLDIDPTGPESTAQLA